MFGQFAPGQFYFGEIAVLAVIPQPANVSITSSKEATVTFTNSKIANVTITSESI